MKTLISDVEHLRENCPWYQALTLETLSNYLAEEAQEVLSALNGQLASERGWFAWQEIVAGLHHKIMHRNQHVFGNLVLKDLAAVNLHWQSVKACERKCDRERINQAMYEIAIEQNEALVTVKHHPSVTIPFEPPPAEKFAPGYTRSAWIWLALTDAFAHANIWMPQEDIKEIAILISKQIQAIA